MDNENLHLCADHNYVGNEPCPHEQHKRPLLAKVLEDSDLGISWTIADLQNVCADLYRLVSRLSVVAEMLQEYRNRKV
jgi:hypothetical protein